LQINLLFEWCIESVQLFSFPKIANTCAKAPQELLNVNRKQKKKLKGRRERESEVKSWKKIIYFFTYCFVFRIVLFGAYFNFGFAVDAVPPVPAEPSPRVAVRLPLSDLFRLSNRPVGICTGIVLTLASTMVTSGVGCGSVAPEIGAAGLTFGAEDESTGCSLPNCPVTGPFLGTTLRLGGMVGTRMYVDEVLYRCCVA